MMSNGGNVETRPVWFVGSSFGSNDDQTERFLRGGIWEGGSENPRTGARYEELIRSINPGDRIAMKSAYVRKSGLPFDNRGLPVSVMRIKAIGAVRDNPRDGRSLRVDWRPVDDLREWYFYTNRQTVWQVQPASGQRNEGYAAALIDFTFDGQGQDIDFFRNAPYWWERFGDGSPGDRRFAWTGFYAEFADRLLAYRHDRGPLVAAIQDMANRSDVPMQITDRYADGGSGPLRDICPFTTIGLFNRGITDANRRAIAGMLAEFLGVEESVPGTFGGIPVLNNMNAWFFQYEVERPAGHIDALWRVFAEAMQFADAGDHEYRSDFVASYADAINRHSVGPRLATGLYWIRAWDYLTLDSRSVQYMRQELKVPTPSGRLNAEEYLALRETLGERFEDMDFPVHSFPELSLAAWESQTNARTPDSDAPPVCEEEDAVEREPEPLIEPVPPYTIDDIVADGCFLERAALETILQRLRDKKNLILQGPPGTGKTWLAKKLAFALVGRKEEGLVRHLQFHPNLSYEDFVRGWRPGGTSGLTLVDGPFLRAIDETKGDPANDYVIVIEEINRGNPAQIFGEMLTLLEGDKRNRDNALALSYPCNDAERVFIPPNLYVIGTMNVADRSLALVDLALRRRFAFIDLEPTFGERWREWVSANHGVDDRFLLDIERRMNALNDVIAGDPGLGPNFRVGHSVVMPSANRVIEHPVEWFRQVVDTEIGPLLNEYWFDNGDRAKEQKEVLLRGIEA